MNEEMEHIENLIGKYIVGEASENEIRELREWCALSLKNQKYLDDAILIYEKSLITSHSRFDSEAAWLKVKNKIENKGGKTNWFIPIWGIAAGLALIFALSFLFYKQWTSPQEFRFMADESSVSQTMPDSSEISLNRNSKVKIAYNEKRNTGRIELEGEALISIPESKKVKWTVETAGLQIEDIGTVFHVSSFADSAFVEVTVQEGIVRFFKTGEDGITINAGQKGIYEKNKGIFSFSVPDPNVATFKTGSFVFQEEPLGQVLEKLSLVFYRNIVMEGDISNCMLTVAFENEDLETILSIIAETLSLEVTDEGSQIKISGDGCF